MRLGPTYNMSANLEALEREKYSIDPMTRFMYGLKAAESQDYNAALNIS